MRDSAALFLAQRALPTRSTSSAFAAAGALSPLAVARRGNANKGFDFQPRRKRQNIFDADEESEEEEAAEVYRPPQAVQKLAARMRERVAARRASFPPPRAPELGPVRAVPAPVAAVAANAANANARGEDEDRWEDYAHLLVPHDDHAEAAVAAVDDRYPDLEAMPEVNPDLNQPEDPAPPPPACDEMPDALPPSSTNSTVSELAHASARAADEGKGESKEEEKKSEEEAVVAPPLIDVRFVTLHVGALSSAVRSRLLSSYHLAHLRFVVFVVFFCTCFYLCLCSLLRHAHLWRR